METRFINASEFRRLTWLLFGILMVCRHYGVDSTRKIACNPFIVGGGAVPLIAKRSYRLLDNPGSTSFLFARIRITTNTADRQYETLTPSTSNGLFCMSRTGSLSITGNAGAAMYTEFLKGVYYNNTAQSPDMTTRWVEIALYHNVQSHTFVCNFEMLEGPISTSPEPFQSTVLPAQRPAPLRDKEISVSLAEHQMQGKLVLDFSEYFTDYEEIKIHIENITGVLRSDENVTVDLSDRDLFLRNATDRKLCLGREHTLLDHERYSKIVVKMFVTATVDGEKYYDLCNITVITDVLDINDNCPVFQIDQMIEESPFPISHSHNLSLIIKLTEEIPIGTEVLPIFVEDSDSSENAMVLCQLSGFNHSSFFKLDNDTGHLRVAARLDREATSLYELRITATDNGSPPCQTDLFVTIYLDDINDNAPRFPLSHYVASFPEDVDVGSLIIIISAVDDDDGVNADISYSIDQNSYFDIDTYTGNVTLRSKVDFENLSENPFLLNITARDHGNVSMETVVLFEARVSDVNDNAPEFGVNDVNVSITENHLNQSFLVHFQISDADSGASGEFHSFLKNDYDSFDVSPNNTVFLTRDFDSQNFSNDSFTLEIIAEDHGNPRLSSTATIHITIEDTEKAGADDRLISNATFYNFVEGQVYLPLNLSFDEPLPEIITGAEIKLDRCDEYTIENDIKLTTDEKAVCPKEKDKLQKIKACGFPSPLLVSDKERLALRPQRNVENDDVLTFDGARQYAVYMGQVPGLSIRPNISSTIFIWFSLSKLPDGPHECMTLISHNYYTRRLVYALDLGFNGTLDFFYRTTRRIGKTLFRDFDLKVNEWYQLTLVLFSQSGHSPSSAEIFLNGESRGKVYIDRPLFQNGIFHIGASPTTTGNMVNHFRGKIGSIIVSIGQTKEEQLRCVFCCDEWLRVDSETDLFTTYNESSKNLAIRGEATGEKYSEILENLVYINAKEQISYTCRELNVTFPFQQSYQQSKRLVKFKLLNNFAPVLRLNGQTANFTTHYVRDQSTVALVNCSSLTLEDDGGTWPYTVEISLLTQLTKDPVNPLSRLSIKNPSANFNQVLNDDAFLLQGTSQVSTVESELKKLVFDINSISTKTSLIFKFVIHDGNFSSSPVYSVISPSLRHHEIPSKTLMLYESRDPVLHLDVSTVDLEEMITEESFPTSVKFVLVERYDGNKEYLSCDILGLHGFQCVITNNHTGTVIQCEITQTQNATVQSIATLFNAVKYYNDKMKNIYQLQPSLKERIVHAIFVDGGTETLVFKYQIIYDGSCSMEDRFIATTSTELKALSTCTRFLGRGGVLITCESDPENCDITTLTSLTSVKEILGELCLIRVPTVESLSGLENLQHVGGIVLQRNQNLTSAGICNSIDGRENASIGKVDIRSNPKLENLAVLRNIKHITGDLRLERNILLNDLTTLENVEIVDGDVYLMSTRLLTLGALKNLREVGGSLNIVGNQDLRNLSGLNNLESIGMNLLVLYNPHLQHIDALSRLGQVGGRIYIQGNVRLCYMLNETVSTKYFQDKLSRGLQWNDFIQLFAQCPPRKCDTNPCQHNATCTDDPTDGYSCECHSSDHYGNSCEYVNECRSSPCQHGGSCSDDLFGFNCLCDVQYTGRSCQHFMEHEFKR
ncbi:uncharacterized protein [Ptychodera flava]|uniref:uncharacterized protein n=1 Tax=Ptychodera flava TaxID=63121 RepID=UPI00396A3153